LSKYPGKSIFITGHSLGGALAVFAAVDIKANVIPSGKVTLYTYGQPRVGNPAFSDYIFTKLDGSYVRVTHYDDTVAHVPPRVGGFKHAGNELWFKNKAMDSVKQECPNSKGVEENGNCSNSFWLKTGIWSHINYMGIEVSGICQKRQPGGTLLGQSIDESENYESYTFVVDSEVSNIKNLLAENTVTLQ
jgi:Lipase (class 3)